MATIYDRLKATADRLLGKYVIDPTTGEAGNNCLWSITSDGLIQNSDEPWDKDLPTPEKREVAIFFFADELEDRQFLKYMANSAGATVNGELNGFMGVQDFEPDLKDSCLVKDADGVTADFKLLTVNAINPVPPTGLPLVGYLIEFGA